MPPFLTIAPPNITTKGFCMKRILFFALAIMASSAMAANGNLGMDARLGYLQNDNDFDKTG